MKWLFATLLGLNLIVFAGMVANKIYNNPNKAANLAHNLQNASQIPQVIINTISGSTPSAGSDNSGSPTGSTQNAPAVTGNKPRTGTPVTAPGHNQTAVKPTAAITPPVKEADAQAQYRACSARVSIPEDDYHRIKGLLTRFPHAATRQVVEGGGDGNSQTSARMNVLFMSVNDQEAGAIQGIVGRYGSLNRAPCNK